MAAVAGLEVTTIWDGPVCTLALRGEARLETVRQFDEAAGDVLERGADHVLIDMSRLSFMDSASTGSLLRFRGQMAEREGSLVLFGLQRVIQRLFEQAGLHEGFVCAKDETAARELLRG